MIKRFSYRSKKNSKKLIFLLDFIRNNHDSDFYLTEENKRIYINDLIALKKLLKNSSDVYELEEHGDYVGIILSWKSYGGNKKRYYVKLLAKNDKTASDLLRGFLWHVDTELFVKLSKKHFLLNVFKKYGFKFAGGRGRQILLHRDKVLKIEKRQEMEEKENEDNIE